MAVKVVFLLALVALACGLPASKSDLESSSDVSAVNEVPASVSEYLEKLYGETPTDIVLENEPTEVEGEGKRVRRAPIPKVCRRVLIHGPNGLNFPRWQCL